MRHDPDAIPCNECGYDLRAAPPDRRCPECDHPVGDSIARPRHLRRRRLKRIMCWFGGGLAALGFLSCFALEHEHYFCKACLSGRTVSSLVIIRPLHGPPLVSRQLQDRTHVLPEYATLTGFLKATEDCEHPWVFRNSRQRSILGSVCGSAAVPPSGMFMFEGLEGFGEFLDATPDLRSPLREKLSAAPVGDDLCDAARFLLRRYCDWFAVAEGEVCPLPRDFFD